MKKHSIFIMTLLLIASLAGCAGQEPDKTETEYSSAVSSTAETASASKVIDSSPAGTVSSSAETKLPEPAPSEPQKEKTEESVLPETSNPEKPTAPVQESSAPPKSTSPQTQKPTGTAPVPSAPPETETPKPTAHPAPTEPSKEPELPAVSEPAKGFTQADHERIVAEVTAYAESYRAKGFTFEWKESMEFGWDVGYMGTPRISRDGVEGTIRTLKYHVDLIVSTSTDPANGITTEYMTYKVVQIEIDGGIAYAVIYGG